jgi:hypothetical protein
MEILLLWLDELDDLAAAALHCWHRFRSACLVAGLAAALALCGDRLGIELAVPALLLANIAIACVVVWTAMTTITLMLERKITSAT